MYLMVDILITIGTILKKYFIIKEKASKWLNKFALQA